MEKEGAAMYYYSTVNGVVLTHSNIKEKDFVSKGTPSAASTKFWISKDGVFMEGNHSDIPANDLGKIIRYIASNRADIIAAWYDYFGN